MSKCNQCRWCVPKHPFKVTYYDGDFTDWLDLGFDFCRLSNGHVMKAVIECTAFEPIINTPFKQGQKLE